MREKLRKKTDTLQEAVVSFFLQLQEAVVRFFLQSICFLRSFLQINVPILGIETRTCVSVPRALRVRLDLRKNGSARCFWRRTFFFF